VGISRVTEHVTVLAEPSVLVADEPASEAEGSASDSEQPRAVEATEAIDPSTVRVVRSPDFEFTATYRVQATVGDEVVLVGSLRRSGRSGWIAVTPSLITLSGGPWRTRQDALVQLLLGHENTRANARRRWR
jgi:hypothetical protein